MELLHPVRARQERKVEERVNDVASHVSAMMITHLAAEAVGDLPVFVGKGPRSIPAQEFVERVEARIYETIETRAPHFAGQLAIDLDRTRRASTENVRIGNHGWRNDIKAEGLTIIVAPAERLAVA